MMFDLPPVDCIPPPNDVIPQVLNVVNDWAINHIEGGLPAIQQIIDDAMLGSNWKSVGTVTFSYHENVEEVYGTFFYQLLDESDNIMDDVPPLRDEWDVDYLCVWMWWERPNNGYGCSGETTNPDCDNWLTLRGVQDLCVGLGYYDALMPELDLDPELWRAELCPADVDGDGIVGILDLLWVLGDWQGVEPFIEILDQWGTCTNYE